jgi:hypothetical protein
MASNHDQLAVPVNLDHIVQDDFLGLNATYHGFAFMPEQVERGMDDLDRAHEFSRLVDMRLNIARTWYRPDWACGESLANTPDWESPKMQAFYCWLEAMQSRSVDVALQAGWWFSRDTYYGQPEPDPAIDIERYTRWVSDSLHQIISVRGFANVRYLVLFTEPTSYESGLLPAGETQWSYYVRVVTALHQCLITDNRRDLVKLIGPNNTHAGRHLAEAMAELDGVLDIYSGHDYNLASYEAWFQLCQSMRQIVSVTGKPFWLDEYGLQDEPARRAPDYGNYLAQAAAASLNAGCQSSFLWLLFDQQYVSADTSHLQTTTNQDSFYEGVHRWGAWKWPHDTLPDPHCPYPHWYQFSLLSRYLGGRGDTLIIGVEPHPPLVVAATRPQSREYSFLVVNTSYQDQSFILRLSRSLNRPFYRYVYIPADIQPETAGQMIGFNKAYPEVGSSLADSLPPRAVAIYSTLRGEAGRPPVQPAWLRASRDSLGRVALTWLDRSKNESGYHIERWDPESAEPLFFGVPAGVKRWVDSAAQNDVRYVYRVCAFNNDGRSDWLYTELR